MDRPGARHRAGRRADQRAVRPLVPRAVPRRAGDRGGRHRLRPLLRRVRRAAGPRAGARRAGAVAVPAGRLVRPVAGRDGRSAQRPDDARHHRSRNADPPLLGRLHARRRRLLALLLVPEPVHRRDVGAGAGRLVHAHVRRLGGRGRLVVPADRLLVPDEGQRRRGPQGVHRQPHRRRRLPARDVPDGRDLRHPEHRRGQRGRRRAGVRLRHAGADRPVPAGRGGRQVRAAPAAGLAARRDGRPHAGLGPDPRGHDGHRRRVPDRADGAALQHDAAGLRRRRLGGRAHRARRGARRAGADGHQEDPGLLHDQPAGLHVRRRRRRRLLGRDLPRVHPRVLQGAALPRLRLGDPRAGRRAGHPSDGRSGSEDADHRHDQPDRHAGDRGRAAPVGLLQQGRHPGARVHLDGYGTYGLYGVLLLTAALTAFYMFRWYYGIFGGTSRMDAKAAAHVHESPATMTVPLMVLAFFAVFAGYLGLPEFAFPNWIAHWLEPATLGELTEVPFRHPAVWVEWMLILASIVAAGAGLALGWWIYAARKGAPIRGLAEGPLARLSRSGLGFDAAYRALFIGGAEGTASGVAVLDRDLVDRGLLGLGTALTFFGRLSARLQSGFVRAYALAMFVGVGVLVILVAWMGVRA